MCDPTATLRCTVEEQHTGVAEEPSASLETDSGRLQTLEELFEAMSSPEADQDSDVEEVEDVALPPEIDLESKTTNPVTADTRPDSPCEEDAQDVFDTVLGQEEQFTDGHEQAAKEATPPTPPPPPPPPFCHDRAKRSMGDDVPQSPVGAKRHRLESSPSGHPREDHGRETPSNPAPSPRPSAPTPLSPSQLRNDLPPPTVGASGARQQEDEFRQAQSDPNLDTTGGKFFKDDEGNVLYKWTIGYAARGGGGRATCKDMDCLERHDQDGVKVIEKGALRIGRRIMMPGKEGEVRPVTMMWYHAKCIFNAFRRSRKTTRIIKSCSDIEGFYDISAEDQAVLERIIAGSENLRQVQFGPNNGMGGAPRMTPDKRSGGASPGDPTGRRDNLLTPPGKSFKLQADRILRKGDRVWTFCRVRPPAPKAGTPTPPGAAPLAEFAIKSAKPEVAMVREEAADGAVIVQFESVDHEKDRLEKYGQKKFAKVKGWLRYPRIFEGKKQRVPVTWIQWNRAPPRLCGCSKQQWGHDCDCGITCSRGTSNTVWGVCQ